MDPKDARQLLQDAELMPAIETSLTEGRELLARCLDAGIPAELGSEACAKPGCSPKAQLLVRKEDAVKVVELLRNTWRAALEQEGVKPVTYEDTGEGEPPCPACGNTQPLVAGACADCGLQLE